MSEIVRATNETDGPVDLSKHPSAIYHVELPPETTSEWQDKMEKGYQTYGKFFKNREECDYFSMLPLDKKQRVMLLEQMVKGYTMKGDAMLESYK